MERLPKDPTPRDRALHHAVKAVRNMEAWQDRHKESLSGEIKIAMRSNAENIAMWKAIVDALNMAYAAEISGGGGSGHQDDGSAAFYGGYTGPTAIICGPGGEGSAGNISVQEQLVKVLENVLEWYPTSFSSFGSCGKFGGSSHRLINGHYVDVLAMQKYSIDEAMNILKVVKS